MKPIFISYVRENEEIVDKFCQELMSRGLKVWLDRQDLNPGSRWKQEIRKAIHEGAFFVACFSKEQNKSDKTYMNEELIIAIDELRQKPSERIWFIPVKLNRCKIPDRNIGGGETLRDLHYINLYKDWDAGIQSILKVVQPEPSVPTKHENTSGNRVDSNTAADFSEGCIDQDSTNTENTFDTEKRDNNAEKGTRNSLKGFITYSHEDTAVKDELQERLAVMEQKHELITWHDGEITAGDEWYEDISKHLAEADILLYLVSEASLASKNFNKELAEALTPDIKVIPIVLERCNWEPHQLAKFEVLPLNDKPISEWEDPSEGWQNVVDGIRTAINEIQSQVASSSSTSEEELPAELALELGNILLMFGQMDKAIEAYSEAIELNPRYTDAYNNRGVVYAEKGDFDRAIAEYSKAIQLTPNYVLTYKNRAIAYYKKGDFDRASMDSEKANQFVPNYERIYNRSRPDYDKKIDYDLAIRIYNKSGSDYDKKGDYDSAIVEYNNAIQIAEVAVPFTPGYDPADYAFTYNNRGMAYYKKGDSGRAIEDFNKAIQLNPNFAEAYYNRGRVFHLSEGDYDRAIEDLNIAIQLNPNESIAYHERGVVYCSKKDFEHAIEDFNIAIQLNPDYAEAYYSRGSTVYISKGDYDRAIEDLNIAIQLNPKDYDAYYIRGMVWLHLQEWEKANSDLKTARRMGMDIIGRFHINFENCATFEQIIGVQLPEDIATLLTYSQV